MEQIDALRAAEDHANIAHELLIDVDTRRNEGPMYGAVKVASAQAHATLALFYQQEAARKDAA